MAMADDINIPDALARVLKEKLEFTGGISFHRAYADAPNPCMELSDLGSIGLPLNSREAQTIKTRAHQAIVDASERGVWFMDADKIVLRNPAWKVWLECIVQEACKTLGIEYAAIKPRCELDKLMIYETGSHLLPRVDTGKDDKTFATIVVVLPSTFTGGAAHISHGSQSAVYDCGRISDLQTSVMAWYTDVLHEVEPVTSGYRLALSYNLLHTTNALRPALSNGDNILNAFRQVLLAWRAGAGLGVPDKILYLLKHEYPQEKLNGAALKGTDAQRTAILDTLGKELGFSLGLASLECHIKGTPEDDGEDHYGKRRNSSWNDWDFEDYGENDHALNFGHIKERSTLLDNFVGLNGGPIADEIKIDGTTKTIPDDLEKTVTSRPHDEQEYDRYFGHNPGVLERWYRRTVLVIWPNFANCVVASNLDDVCDELRDEADEFDKATPEQRATIEFLLARNVDSSEDAVTVADAICNASCGWRDLELWKRAVERCSRAAGVATLDADSIYTAIKAFGFEAVTSSLETMIRHEKCNKPLFAFLDEFRAFNWDEFEEGLGDNDDDRNADKKGETLGILGGDKLVAAVTEWIDAQWSASLKSLRPLSKEDFVVLSQLAMDNGGASYVRDSILPQLPQQNSASILHEYALYMAKEKVSAGTTDQSVKHDVVSQILKASLSKLTITLSPNASYPHSYHSQAALVKPDESFEVAKTYFETCLALDCFGQAGAVVEKVSDTTGHSATEAYTRAQLLMLPFLTWAVQRLAKQPKHKELPELAVLHNLAITSVLADMATRPRTITREELRKLLQTISLPGGLDVFVTSILPGLNTLASSEVSAKVILEELQPRLIQLVLPASYQDPILPETIASVAKKYAQCVSIGTTEAVIAAMGCCIQTQAFDGVWGILNRVLDPEKLKEHTAPSYPYMPGAPQGNTYADRVVLPLVSQLRQLAIKHTMLADLAPAFRQIARTYTQKVLGYIPSANPDKRLAEIRRWTCECSQCNTIRTFLLAKPDRSITLLSIGAPKRKHVETYLNRYVTSEAATWQTVTSYPQGIAVTKTDLLIDRSVWKENRKKAIKLVKDASPDEEERMRIYGDEYVEYARWIKGVPMPGAAAAADLSTNAASTSSASCDAPISTPGAIALQQPDTVAASTSSTNCAAPMPTSGAVALQHQRVFSAAGPSTNTASRPSATAGVRRSSNTQPNPTLPPAKRAKTSSGPLNVIAVIDLTES